MAYSFEPDRPLTAAELAHYLADRYGTCALDASTTNVSNPNPCKCLDKDSPHPPSLACKNWRPTKARMWAELAEEMKALEERRRGTN